MDWFLSESGALAAWAAVIVALLGGIFGLINFLIKSRRESIEQLVDARLGQQVKDVFFGVLTAQYEFEKNLRTRQEQMAAQLKRQEGQIDDMDTSLFAHLEHLEEVHRRTSDLLEAIRVHESNASAHLEHIGRLAMYSEETLDRFRAAQEEFNEMMKALSPLHAVEITDVDDSDG